MKPQLNIWISYVELLEKNPYELLLLKLKANFDESTIARLLASSSTKDVITQRVEDALLNSWLKKDASVEYV